MSLLLINSYYLMSLLNGYRSSSHQINFTVVFNAVLPRSQSINHHIYLDVLCIVEMDILCAVNGATYTHALGLIDRTSPLTQNNVPNGRGNALQLVSVSA